MGELGLGTEGRCEGVNEVSDVLSDKGYLSDDSAALIEELFATCDSTSTPTNNPLSSLTSLKMRFSWRRTCWRKRWKCWSGRGDGDNGCHSSWCSFVHLIRFQEKVMASCRGCGFFRWLICVCLGLIVGMSGVRNFVHDILDRLHEMLGRWLGSLHSL